jgi:hypothetical protein
MEEVKGWQGCEALYDENGNRTGTRYNHYGYGWPNDWTVESGVEVWKPVMDAMEEIPSIEYEEKIGD